MSPAVGGFSFEYSSIRAVLSSWSASARLCQFRATSTLVNARTGEVEIYRPPSFSWGEDLARGLNAVLPVKAMELESRRKFKSWVGAIMIIQQPLSRDTRLAQHLSKLRLIDHGRDMIPRNPITLPLLKTLLQFLDILPV